MIPSYVHPMEGGLYLAWRDAVSGGEKPTSQEAVGQEFRGAPVRLDPPDFDGLGLA